VRRLVLPALAVALLVGVAPAAAAAEPCPPYPGMQNFPAIHGPEEPENFCWEVSLGEDQELRQIDAWHAGVYWVPDEVLAMHINAPAAHDAEGVAVPTTLAVVGENLITLTVHHRAGNPAAGGAPFTYPVVAGVGWEGGFKTYPVEMPPPEVTTTAPPAEQPATPLCEVPALRGKTVRGARRALRRAHCELGPVRGERTRGARVAKQYQPGGKLLPTETAVGVKLG
jgi:hypothetical protein